MPRTDIWQDGINTRFSRENQPPGRGRPKGRQNRSTVFRAVMQWLKVLEQEQDQQRRNHRNALRRERYRLKKNGPGEPPTRPDEPQEPPLRL